MAAFSLGKNPNITAELLTWSKALKIATPAISYSQQELTALLTAALRNERVLLLIDDIWKAEHALPFLFTGRNSRILMATRLNGVARSLAPTPTDIYQLPVLTEKASLELLSNLAPNVLKKCPEEGRVLIGRLGGVPLAIQAAGRWLDSEMQLGSAAQDLLNDLCDDEYLLKLPIIDGMSYSCKQINPTIATLLKRSIDLLDEDTLYLFVELNRFPSIGFNTVTIAQFTPNSKLFIHTLVNNGLLEPLSGGKFQILPLLAAYARSMGSVRFQGSVTKNELRG